MHCCYGLCSCCVAAASATSTQSSISSCYFVPKTAKLSQSVQQHHCPQSFLRFAGACHLLKTKEEFIFFFLVRIRPNRAKFSVLTLVTGISGLLWESSQTPTKGSYNSLLPLWVANVQLPRTPQESISLISYFFSWSELFAVLDFEGNDLICLSSISLLFDMLYFVKANELSVIFLVA